MCRSVLNLVHQNLPSSVQMHQASSTLPPLSSVLHPFAKQWFWSLLCTLLIALIPSGVSSVSLRVDGLHLAASGEGEILSKDAANTLRALRLGRLSLCYCCYLFL
jgi:hypothetical protein